MLEPLMRAGPGCVLCALLVSCIVHAGRAHAERRRDAPRMRLSGRGAGTDFGEFLRTVPNFSGDKRHSSETASIPSHFPMQGFNFQCADLEIFTLVHP